MKKRHRASAQRKPENVGEQITHAAKGEHPGGLPGTNHARPWIWHLTGCVVLLLMVGIVYSNSFQSGWVLDNKRIIQLDPRNKAATIENLKLIWEKDYWWPNVATGAYRPIVSTTYWLNWSVFGNGFHSRESDQVIGFHWVNLIAHGINAVIAYLLMLKLLRRRWAAFFAAALFAVHPIATESVTNIVGRADEFAAMSFLGCTLLFIRSTEVSGLRKLPWLLGVIMLFSVGLLSKESSMVFIAVPILFDGIYRWGSEAYSGRRVRSILLDSLCYIVMALPIAALFLIRSVIFRQTPVPLLPIVDNPILRLAWNDASSLSSNVHNWILGRMTASNAATKALWKLIWPVHLSSDYSYNQIKLFGWHLSKSEDVKAILSALFIAGTLILAARCYKRHKAVSFFIVFYWIAYGPTSNFLIDGSSIMAERFLYLPLVAFSALLVLGVDILASRFGISLEFDLDSIRRSWPRLVPHAVFLLILLLCGVRSYQRNFDWQSEVTISQSAIESSPNSFRGYFLLAFAYYDSDPIEKIDRIIELAEKGIAILDPLPNEENYSRMYLHLGMYYGMKGESSETRNADGSLTVNDTAHEWFKKSARVLERGTEIDQAVSDANYARELKRGNTNIPDAGLPELYLYLGMAYAELGFNEKALEAFKYMRHLEPREPQAYLRIASAQLALRQFEDAAVSLIQCVLLDPQRTEAWQSLTEIYSQINREPVPAVQVTDGHERLQEDNRMVQLHLLYAYRDFIKTARFSKLPEMLRDMRDDAVNSHHFNPGLLDDALYGKAERPKPPSPAFHVFGKKLLEK